MIGNDVVDLTDAEAKPGARHPRFDARVFTDDERQAIAASPAPDRQRWRLWAAKEAAYKAARKSDATAVFSPRRFEVDLVESVVRFGGARFAILVDETEEYVHVIAETPPPRGGRRFRASSRACRGAAMALRRCSGRAARSAALHATGEAAAVRALAIDALARALDADPRDLAIVKRGRIPCVERCGEPLPVDLSLSHHGRFVACAFRVVGRAVPGPPCWRGELGSAEAV